jgi:hypothetical protein
MRNSSYRIERDQLRKKHAILEHGHSGADTRRLGGDGRRFAGLAIGCPGVC